MMQRPGAALANRPLHFFYLCDCSGSMSVEGKMDILNEAIAKTRHLPIGRTVYVGDAIWDVTTTRNMQIPLIGIRIKGDTETLTSAGAQHVITDYSDYDGFLDLVERAEVAKMSR